MVYQGFQPDWKSEMTRMSLNKLKQVRPKLAADLEREQPKAKRQPSPLEEQMMREIRRARLPEPKRQYRAIEGRRFQVDFCWPRTDGKPGGLAIEIDGEFNHARYYQVSNDARKRNLLQLDGWVVLVFTGEMLKENSDNCIAMIKTILERK